MGLLDSVFGKSESGKSSSKIKLPPYVETARANYFNQNLIPAQSWFSDPNNTTYRGPQIADLNQNTSQSWDKLLGASNLIPDSAPIDLANLASEYLSGKFLDPRNNPTFNNAIGAAFQPLDENFQRTVLPSITSQAQQQGAWGNNRVDFTKAQATDDLQTTKANISSQMAYDEAKRQEGLRLTSPNMFRDALTLATLGPDLQGQVGAQQQARSQQEVEAQKAAWQAIINGMLGTFQPFQSTYGSVPSVSGTEATQGSSGGGLSGLLKDFALPAAGFGLDQIFGGGGGGGELSSFGDLFGTGNASSSGGSGFGIDPKTAITFASLFA